jgi:hypothetical protein
MRRLPLILLAIHSALVVLIAATIYGFVRAGYMEAVQLWGPVALLDLPITPILAFGDPYIRYFVAANTVTEWVFLPSIEYLIVGGLMWFSIGWAIRKVWQKHKLNREADETSPI